MEGSARRYGVNPKTVAKWKRRTSVADVRTDPKTAKSTVLSAEEEAIVVAFWRLTLLPLDDCLQRHCISRLPDVEGDKPVRKKFKVYPLGCFHTCPRT